MSATTRPHNVTRAESSPLRALLVSDDGSAFRAGVLFAFLATAFSDDVLFAFLATAYSDDWTSGQREHFLDVIDREFPDVAARTANYLSLLEGGRHE